jgi:hypothetical protein
MATSDHQVDRSRATWRKSTRSSANGECVEVAAIAGTIAVRDSKRPDGGVLVVGRERWQGFLADVRSRLA